MDAKPLRVAAIQMPHGTTLEGNLGRAAELVAQAASSGAQLALLPEYFFSTFAGTPETLVEHAQDVRQMLSRASQQHGIAVGGNVIERGADGAVQNLGIVYERGRIALEQAKVHPMPREAASGVMAGDVFRTGDISGHRAGMLVCADILYPEAARIMGLRGADLLLNPVMSPWREHDDGREARVAMYVARAYDAQAFVVKAAGFKRPAPGAAAGEAEDADASPRSGRSRRDASSIPPFGIAGRSLVAAPWGVLARAGDDFGEEVLLADLDLEKLATFRAHQAHFPARRPDAYRELVE